MCSICSVPSGRKMMMSSTRLRNSGRKCDRSACVTCVSTSAQSAAACSRMNVAADVRRHDDDGVAEVHRAALRVREPAVVEDLQQDVEHVRMRLLDLVEQDDRVRAAAHRLGELPAFLVADVARRRADEPRDGVLLHVLGHVDAHHRVLVVEQELGERARRLRLADAGGAEEDERADRAVRILQSGAGAAHRVGDRLHGLVLADDALGRAPDRAS